MATSVLFQFSFVIILCCRLAVSLPFPPFPSDPPTTEVVEKLIVRNDSFHLSMSKDITLPSNSQTQLQNFKTPEDSDTLGLEPGHYFDDVKDWNSPNGVFTVKRQGIFLVTASVQLTEVPEATVATPMATEAPATTEQLPKETEAPQAAMEEEPERRRRSVAASQLQEVSVAVCIDATSDRCNEALYTTGVLSGSQTTLAVFGNIKLKRDQKVSVRITNKSGLGVIVLNRSSFSVHKL